MTALSELPASLGELQALTSLGLYGYNLSRSTSCYRSARSSVHPMTLIYVIITINLTIMIHRVMMMIVNAAKLKRSNITMYGHYQYYYQFKAKKKE